MSWLVSIWRKLAGEAPRSIAVCICCFGIYHAEARSPKEMKGIEQYIKACARYIVSLYLEGRLAGVFLAGGFTNTDFPELSEAQTTASLLREELAKYGVLIYPHLEESSRNTPQNLDRGCRLIWNELPPFSRDVVFITDRPRHFKVWAMGHRHFGQSFGVGMRSLRVVSFPRLDTHPHSRWYWQFADGLLYLFQPQRFIDALKVGQSD